MDGFFSETAKKIDPPTELPAEELNQKLAGYQGNLFRKRVAVFIFELNIIRVAFYLTTWAVKILSYFLLNYSKTSGKISKITCYLIHYGQKAHMVALNTVLIDLIPYTTRAIFQVKN